MSADEHRSVAEIRASLAEAKEHLSKDLEALDTHLHRDFTPQAIVGRHPLLFTAAGVAVVLLLVTRPTILKRGVTRVAEAGMPWLLRGLLKDI